MALTSFGWTIIFSAMQGRADAGSKEASDELREAQLAVVGTSYDAEKAGVSQVAVRKSAVRALESPAIPALPTSLEVAPTAAAAAAGPGSAKSGGGDIKAHTALEPRLWDLYCKARRSPQQL